MPISPCIPPSNSLTTQTASRFLPQLLIKYHDMTHLSCRDVNPPMPCFLKIKSRDKVSLFRGLHLQSRMSVLQISVQSAHRLCFFGNDLPAKRYRLSLSSLRCHFSEFLACYFLVVVFFCQREALLLVLVRFDALAWTLGLNTSFAGARGAIPAECAGAPIGDREESY